MAKPKNPARTRRGKTKRATGESAMQSIKGGGAAKVLKSMEDYPQDSGRSRKSGG